MGHVALGCYRVSKCLIILIFLSIFIKVGLKAIRFMRNFDLLTNG